MDVNRNSLKEDETEGRSVKYEDKIERYIKTHDVTFNVPFIGKVTLENSNLDDEEVGLNIKFGEDGVEEGMYFK